MNSENSKTSDPHRILLKLTDKIDLRRKDKYFVYQIHKHIKMDTLFMNPENRKTPKPHVLILKLANKLDLRIVEKVIALSNLSIYYTLKNLKKLIQ